MSHADFYLCIRIINEVQRKCSVITKLKFKEMRLLSKGQLEVRLRQQSLNWLYMYLCVIIYGFNYIGCVKEFSCRRQENIY